MLVRDGRWRAKRGSVPLDTQRATSIAASSSSSRRRWAISATSRAAPSNSSSPPTSSTARTRGARARSSARTHCRQATPARAARAQRGIPVRADRRPGPGGAAGGRRQRRRDARDLGPGGGVVAAVAAAGLRVTTAPGPSAVVAALSVSGLATERFVMEGFLPREKASGGAVFEGWGREPRTVVFYESPQRLAATLCELAAVYPDASCRRRARNDEGPRGGPSRDGDRGRRLAVAP